MSQEPEPSDQPDTLSAYESGPVGAGIDWTDPNLPVAPLYMSTGGVIGVALLGVLFVFLSSTPLWHTDFWAHLKYGEWIVAHRELPKYEPLCQFTDKQMPMFDAMWLSQVGYHAVFRAGEAAAGGDARHRFEGGVELVRQVHVLAVVVALALLGLAYRRIGDSVPWAIGGVILAFIPMMAPLGVQRPQTLALVCYAATLYGVSRSVPTRAALIWIPLVVVLWANLHASFVVGIGVVGVVFLGRVIGVGRENGWSLRSVWQDTAVRRLLTIIVLSLIGPALLNPYGPSYYAKIGQFGNHPNLATFEEWQPLNFSDSRGGHWLYLGLVVLLVVTQLISPRPFNTAQMLFILTLGVWPLFQQRAMIWWVPVVPWIVAPHWVAAAERWGIRAPDSIPSFRKTALTVLLLGVMVIGPLVMGWKSHQRPRPVGTALHRDTPYDVAAVLKGEEPADRDRVKGLIAALGTQPNGKFIGRVFCSERLGEYLIWALPPEIPVMLFNHIQLFTPGYWTDCQTLKAARPGWWEVLDRFGPGIVVVETDLHPRLCALLRKHPDWLVAVDEADGLFVAVRKTVTAGGKSP